ncbi:hypothetical protein HOJ01_03560 [bacterium]|jgi:hypothetical protein|nr:hypothetical protein [bacterium]MBT6293859.1 hypothetical protein [bacterium]
MYKREFEELLTKKLNKYQDILEEIEDRLDTLPPFARDDMQMELNDLYRSFEDLESRIDEFDSMTEKDFIEEEEIMIEKITNIEDSFSEFMHSLHRVAVV